MTSQKGFAHAFLIIGLVIALIGALGFVFWQNFIYEEPTSEKISIIKSEENGKTTESKQELVKVNEDDYSFSVANGFRESSEQMFTYTASLKAVNTYINDEGDYFEVLVPQGGGGGISGDYFWTYNVNNSKLSISKSDRCVGANFACTANNDSVEGIISSQSDNIDYYLAFGNKTKNETKLAFVDKFVSTFQFNSSK